jgi:hypothetical protein
VGADRWVAIALKVTTTTDAAKSRARGGCRPATVTAM